jgi:hypothetical protein
MQKCYVIAGRPLSLARVRVLRLHTLERINKTGPGPALSRGLFGLPQPFLNGLISMIVTRTDPLHSLSRQRICSLEHDRAK